MGVRTVAAGPTPGFWAGRHVLVTGHTGFKGAWLAIWLHQLGAKVTGISLPPLEPSLFSHARVGDISDSHFVDLRDPAPLGAMIRSTGAEIIFHLAAQSLVLAGYREPLATFATNIMGTANLLEGVRSSSATKVIVAVTTDKVYRDQNSRPHQETDPLGGHDPYSASKAAAEIIIDSYRRSFLAEQGVALASARAGNVIGGGDWAKDRLIPDAVRAWSEEQVLHVRRPRAVRPWQHVLEPLAGYLVLAQRLRSEPALAGAYNFGPDPNKVASVGDIVQIARAAFGKGEVAWGEDDGGPFEAPFLSLDNGYARARLGVHPRWVLSHSVGRTIDWYRRTSAGQDARAACLEDLAAFQAAERVDG